MRCIVLLGLLLAMWGLTSSSLPAQAPVDWPKNVGNKKLEDYVREMKDPDASTRDQAIRTLPLFGPDARKLASSNLIYAMTKDPDINVRLAAISVVPMIWFDDAYVDQGLTALVTILKPASGAANHTLYEATVALTQCGPLAKRAIPTLVDYTLVDTRSWANRKAAAAALGYVGQPMKYQDGKDGKDEGPDISAIRGLVKSLRGDTSHQVRREVINSLLLLGPPLVESVWRELRDALNFAVKDRDKIVALWARVVYIRTEQEFIKPTDAHLTFIAKQLASTDQVYRSEAIRALGILGEEAKSRLSELLTIARDDKEEPQIVAMAIWAMSRMPSEKKRILDALEPFKMHKDTMIKQAAENASKALLDNAKAKDNLPPKK